VQAAAGEKRRRDLRPPVRLPNVLQQQELQVRSGTATLAPAWPGRPNSYRRIDCASANKGTMSGVVVE
jgi:hypothetical protein